MEKPKNRLNTLLTCLVRVLLLMAVFGLVFQPRPAQAGSGPTVDIPASTIVPTLDGVCGPSEYSDAVQRTITVGTSTFPVYMKHTADYAYFCFGDATTSLPLPNGGDSQIAVYIDRDDDGLGNDGDDFGIWVPYNSSYAPWAAYWPPHDYGTTIHGGWDAMKYPAGNATPTWQAEIRISNQLMGGWKHTVGLALFYHWWRRISDDYSWPANGIYAAPQYWGNAHFITGEVEIPNSATVPTINGACDPGTEYADAATSQFNAPGGTVTTYLKHTTSDLYVCLSHLTIPAVGQMDGPNAALYLDRSGKSSETPDANDLAISISYNGLVRANSGTSGGFTGPPPGSGEYDVVRSQYGGGWDAEFRISGNTIGRWWSRWIGLTVAEQGVAQAGDDYGWPVGFSAMVPNSWGAGYLLHLGYQGYLPIIRR